MLYPVNLENKINFDKIKELIREECSSSLGADFVGKIAFAKDIHLVNRLLDQTEEFRQIILSGESFPASNYLNIFPYLQKSKVEGTFLYEDEFQEIKLSLITLRGCVDFFDKYKEDYPQLFLLLGMVSLDNTLLRAIERMLDEKGKIKNNATKELGLIRSQIIYEESRLRKVLDTVFRAAKAKGYIPEDATVTIRGGRMVMPVLAENKRKIKGFIHDESATGQTVYMEPAEVLDINNELKDLEYMERREIQKILTQLTDTLRTYVPELRQAFHFLGLVDFIRAKAKFALKINAHRPVLEKTKGLDWTHARHPLLEMALKQQKKEIVPLNISLDHNKRLLVISGPNAGGKSVTLKTVALLQYMVQCGLLIPVEAHSKCSLFDNFFIDIGDEQNIENDLSTYSSHLMSMKYFTQFANKKTIIFIDEFGTGTEPQFGGAIAEALLVAFNQTGAYGIITTHYGNLKQIAAKSQGMVNGAMRYDVDQLEPLYQLDIGKPGSSFALEIATKIGISKEVIEYAKGQIGEERVRYDKLLNKLESEKNKYEQILLETQKKDRQLEIRLKEYNDLKMVIESSKKDLIQQAKVQAKGILDEANKKIEETIRTIKENQADKNSTQRARKELEELKIAIKPEKTRIRQPEIKIEEGEIRTGDHVRIKDSGTVAEVISIKNHDVEILIGELKSNVKKNRLEKISNTTLKKEKKAISRSVGYDTHSKMTDFSPNLDLRGKRGEEILVLIQNFIDEGHMLGLKDVRIVHGKGDGILREVTRNLLNGMSSVAKYQDEHADRGGSGVTLVTLR
jgi:DNA mismatch repair protein MutS2